MVRVRHRPRLSYRPKAVSSKPSLALLNEVMFRKLLGLHVGLFCLLSHLEMLETSQLRKSSIYFIRTYADVG